MKYCILAIPFIYNKSNTNSQNHLNHASGVSLCIIATNTFITVMTVNILLSIYINSTLLSFTAVIKKFWEYAVNKKCVSTFGETNKTKRKPHKGTERRSECYQKDVIVFLPVVGFEILFRKF